MPGRLIIARHAHAVGNSDEYLGRKDSPLSPKGLIQANQLARQLAAEPVSQIICSPLRRARQTALMIGLRQNLPLQLCDALAELDMGQWQGRPKPPPGHRVKLSDRFDYAPVPGGESLWDVWERVEPISQRLTGALKNTTTLVVAHYWPVRFLVAQVLAMPFEVALKLPFKPRNAGFGVVSV